MKAPTDQNCKSCSKESYAKVPIARVTEKLNELFARNDLDAVGRLLAYWENEARILRDERGLLEILNEQIGYYRRTGERDKALAAVKEAFLLIEENGLKDLVSSATVFLNGATTMKAFGLASEAMSYYEAARKIYEKELDSDDYRLAAFHNNVSSAYKDLGDFEKAEQSCYKAIAILKKRDEFYGEIAVTLVNLAHLYHDADPFDDRICELLDQAWEYLISDKNQKDGDFAFICTKCYPSFGFFGYFEREAELKALAERIYAGN